MGKGDQRSKRGKIYRGTYGKSRLRKDNKKESSDGEKGKSEQPQKKSESAEKQASAEASA